MEYTEVVLSLCLSAMTFKSRASETAGVGWDVSHLLKSQTTQVSFQGLQEGEREQMPVGCPGNSMSAPPQERKKYRH